MMTGHRGDALLWVALVGMIAFEHVVVSTSGGPAPWWWAVLIIATVSVALTLRHERPHAALALVGLVVGARVVWSAVTGAPTPLSYAVAMAVVSWLVGRHTTGSRALVLVVVAVDAALLGLGIAIRGDTGLATVVLSWLVTVLWSLLFVVLPWLVGRHRQQQALLVTAGWERAERMEREQRLLVDRARLRERALIAQDMHDSLGHELGLIALRAGALEVAPDLTDRHRRAAGELREAAGTATDRLAEVIGLLRDDDVRAPLTPTAEGVPELVDRAASSGMTVRLIRSGEAAEVPSQVLRAVHRVVREGLTNATKHAPGAAVTVRIGESPSRTSVSVVNTAAHDPGARVHGSGGHGLRGLGELVALLGGSVRSGATVEGGFGLTAVLPHDHEVEARPDGEDELAPATSSADERATVRRRARRGLVVAVVAPFAMAVAVVVVFVGYYVGISYAAILDPDDYERLRIGDSRATTEEVLPPLEMVDAPVDRGSPPPSGASCEYYRPDGPFSITFAYRLCFEDDVLVAKDTIRTGAVTPEEENP